MEPPPRRDKLSLIFKKLQSAHTECLSRKNQLEIDFLNKMKSYSRQRSQLELDYGLALQRLSHQSQMDPQICEELGYSNRSLYAVWNSYLEDCTKVGKQHQSLSHFYAQNVGDNLKALYTNKIEAGRKCLERLGRCHNYIQMAVKELEKSRREYYVSRTAYEELANKAESFRDKLQKKSSGLFQSRDQLEKEYEKFSGKRDEALRQSIHCRNVYLVQLEAVKTHQEHYRSSQLAVLAQEIEQGLFDQVWTYLSAVVAIEKENYHTIEKAITTLSKEVEDIMNPEEHHRAFLLSDRSLKYPIQVVFEPCLHDKDSNLAFNKDTELAVVNEARKWVMSSVRHKASIEELKKKLFQLQKLQNHAWEARKNTNASHDAGMQELARKIDEIKESVRREELISHKAEALVEFFRRNGVNVDELLKAGQTIPDVPSVNTFPQIQVSRSRRSSLSQASSDGSSSEQRGGSTCYRVLYDYKAQQEDELSLTRDEEIMLFDDPAEVPWPRGENSSGQTGLVPCNYVQKIVRDSEPQSPRLSEASGSPNSGAGSKAKPVIAKKPIFDIVGPDPKVEEGFEDQEAHTASVIPSDAISWCEALLEYDGDMPDEISFRLNDLIAVVDREPNGVDDGWWTGHVVRTGQRGTFLAMMTQEVGQTQAEETLRRLKTGHSSIKRRGKSNHDLVQSV